MIRSVSLSHADPCHLYMPPLPAHQADGEPYKVPLRAGDRATLACLRRLGCPWGPGVKDLTDDMCSIGARVWLGEVGWPYRIVTEEDESEEEEEEGGDQGAEEGQE